jgi:hypothetical protein
MIFSSGLCKLELLGIVERSLSPFLFINISTKSLLTYYIGTFLRLGIIKSLLKGKSFSGFTTPPPSRDVLLLKGLADHNLTFLDEVCNYLSILFFKRACP